MENKTPNPKPKPIHVSREQIKATKAFQNATTMIQNITLRRTNFRCIEHGVNVVANIGFDKWNDQTQSSFVNREIIREIVQLKTQNSK